MRAAILYYRGRFDEHPIPSARYNGAFHADRLALWIVFTRSGETRSEEKPGEARRSEEKQGEDKRSKEKQGEARRREGVGVLTGERSLARSTAIACS
jgi:hypothetical protein